MTKKERLISVKKKLAEAVNFPRNIEYYGYPAPTRVEQEIVISQLLIMKALFLLLDEITAE
jgi:hypothetical protein